MYNMLKYKKFLAVALFAALPIVTGPAHAETPPEEARAFIEALANKAIGALSGGADLQVREEKVRKLLADNLDLQRMGRFVLANRWKSASQSQREEYISLFSDYVLTTYSRQLGGYSGQTFKVVDSIKLTKRDALVTTEIFQDGAPPVAAGWRVRKFKDGSLRILDVVVEKLSMVQAQQEQFNSIASRDGVDGVIRMLRLKLTKYAAQS